MLSTSHLIGFVGATDLGRARAFYEGVLGLHVEEQNAFACVLDANGMMLRVTAVDSVTPAAHTVLGWRVDDIARNVRELSARGVAFARYDGIEQDGEGIWTTPGADKV